MVAYSSILDQLEYVLEEATKFNKTVATRATRVALQNAMRLGFRKQMAVVASNKPFRGLIAAVEVAADYETELDARLARADRASRIAMEQAIQVAAEAGLALGGEAFFAAFAQSLTDDGETSFNLSNPKAVEYLEKYGAKQIAGINDTTREQIRNLVARGVGSGHSYGRIAKDIRSVYTDFSVKRARVIATYEVGQAYEAGSHIAAADLATRGVQTQKSWLTAGDSNVSRECRDNAGAGWIARDEDFPSGHNGPLAHPVCRCTILWRVATEEGGD